MSLCRSSRKRRLLYYNFSLVWKSSIIMMMLLVGSNLTTKVRSSWIVTTTLNNRHHRSGREMIGGYCFSTSSSSLALLTSSSSCSRNHHFFLSSLLSSSRSSSRIMKRQFRTSSLLTLNMAVWNVGDSVNVRINDKNISLGRIKERRGGGWYTVQLVETDTVMKCRGTQLRPLSSSSSSLTTTDATTTDTAINTEKTTATKEKETPPPPIRTNNNNGIIGGTPPPPPTIIDLDAAIDNIEQVTNPIDRQYLEQVAYHASFDKWVVFTDLHCSPASLDTCLEVLQSVHDIAISRNAGVLFLGDFWHHRGTLRVDCLNAILEHFKSWKVPMVLIPGNHDQVTLGGYTHSLTPLENSYRVGSSSINDNGNNNNNENIIDVPGPLVFTYPTKFRNALLIPHIRDISTMESILRSKIAKQSSSLFVHADVTGAFLNDLTVSFAGIPPASFPSNKRIYSGHFHKPHIVQAGDVKIEYLGSPYEVSLSEAQQAKSLAILDDKWQCMEYVPLDIGCKHYKVNTWYELLQLRLRSNNDNTYHSNNGIVKAGDRIVVTISKEETESIQPAITTHIKELRKGGATVEIRETKPLPTDTMGTAGVEDPSQLEEMTPETTWKAYLNEVVRREVLTESKSQAIREAGLTIIEEIQGQDTLQSKDMATTDLQLTSVTVEGFGPFKSSSTYPLLDRGLVLLRGTNKDGGADSNGSGKSSLAMAALWGLTGSMDPRRVQDAKVADIVNDDCKTAKVSVKGRVNGSDFSVTRTKTPSKSNLNFNLNGIDMTSQSVKETQQMIEENLGITSQILSRAMFHGQHSLDELLEATDARLKEELSLVVPLSLWRSAATLARSKSREAGKKASELNGMVTIRSEDIEKLFLRRDKADEVAKAKQRDLKNIEMQHEEELKKLQEGVKIDDETSSSEFDFENLEIQLQQVSDELKQVDKHHRSILDQRDTDIGPLERSFNELSNSLTNLSESCQANEREVFAASMKLDLANDNIIQLEQKWKIDLSSGRRPSQFVTPETCPTCQQPISADGDGHSHTNIQRLAEDDIDRAIDAKKEAQVNLVGAKERLSLSNAALVSRERTMKGMREDLDRAELRWANEIQKAEEELASKRRLHEQISEQLSDLARKSQRISQLNTMETSINAKRTEVKFSNETYTAITEEIMDAETRLEELKFDMEEENKKVRLMADLGEALGQRGVQTFVLQNVVDALQTVSQIYLDELSDGSQRLELSLDAGDRISRTAYMRGKDGIYKERPLSTLSGGQWRRCSLALTLGFAELVARRGKLRPSMCVLDEPLTHLDRSGRAKVGEVIRKMLYPAIDSTGVGLGGLGVTTILLILQDLASEELEEAFDCIDEVVKDGGTSFVKVDEVA